MKASDVLRKYWPEIADAVENGLYRGDQVEPPEFDSSGLDYIPNSWVEGEIRHVYVWDESIDQRYAYKDGKLKQLKEIF